MDAEGAFHQGVAQSDHLHVMLQGGQIAIERVFPGLMQECAADDEMTHDWGPETYWINPFGPFPRKKTSVRTWQFSRKTLDERMLRRLLQIENVSVQTARVLGLVHEAGRVTGVRVAATGEGAEEAVMSADLVVDCRGRNSPLVRELREMGYPEPPTSRVDNILGYASRFFQLPPGEEASWKLTYYQVRQGVNNRGGALTAYADGSLIAILIGYGDDRPNADEDEFMAFAESIPDPVIFADLKRAAPAGKARIWRNLGNCCRHFGRMSSWPRGLIVLGDAFCHFNPVYAQGMTVAASQAAALADVLGETRDLQSQPWEATFQKRLEKLVTVPWMMSVTEDQRSEDANPGLSTRMLHTYLDQVLQGAIDDTVLHNAFLRVMHMVSSPALLFAPWIMLRVLGRSAQRALRGSAGAPGRPIPAAIPEAKRSAK